MVVHTFNPNAQEAELCELRDQPGLQRQIELHRNPVSENQKDKNPVN